MALNSRLASEVKGLQTNVDYAGAATNAIRVQRFIDLIAQESTQAQRGHLDMMSPLAQRQLYAELLALKAVITA